MNSSIVKSSLPTIKIAILADSTSQFISKNLSILGSKNGILYEIYESDFDQIDQEIFNESSNLYKFSPDFIFIFRSSQKLLTGFYKNSYSTRNNFFRSESDYASNLFNQISRRLQCKVIFNTFPEIDDSIFGNFSGKFDISFAYQVKKLNLSLMDLCQLSPNLYLINLDSLASDFGLSCTTDNRLFYLNSLVFNFDFLPIVIRNLNSIILCATGNIKKCLILDLDNTIWGGIIGDDGLSGIEVGNRTGGTSAELLGLCGA
jgi:predicted enzyme involved in methoxymalonyl-ACP biosynthesis